VDGEGEMCGLAAWREGVAGRRRTERSMGAAEWEERRRRRGKEDTSPAEVGTMVRGEGEAVAGLAQTLSFLHFLFA
jgi:hypothetical protein